MCIFPAAGKHDRSHPSQVAHEHCPRTPHLHAAATGPVFPPAWRIGLWWPRCAGWLHAPRPGGNTPLDHRRRLQGGPRARPARAGAAGRATGHLPRLRSLPHRRRHAGRHCLRAALVPDGGGAGLGLCPLWRPDVDAVGVLRRGRGSDRHHRHQRAQAHHQERRQRQAAVGRLPAAGGSDGGD